MIDYRHGGLRSLLPLAVAAALMPSACGRHSSVQSPGQRAQAAAELTTYATCMRSHGIADFPNPSTGPGGGVGYPNAQAQAVDQNTLAYRVARTACSRLPGAATAQQLLKSHG